jgi:hypothetical protein
LISDKHVVTSALSVSYAHPGEPWKPFQNKEFRLYFGTTKMNSTNEPGAVFIDGVDGIEKIVLHPIARNSDDSKKLLQSNSLAVFFLENSIQFSSFISPVCLWKFDTKASEQVGQVAYGVGYGWDENGIVTGIRKFVPMIITDIHNYECKRVWGEHIKNIQTGEYFCAIGDKNNFAYQLDNPLFIKINGKWYLRGIISGLDFITKTTMLYEDQSAKLIDWISSITQ